MGSQADKLAKQLMLKDLRRILNDWEEGKYTWKDIAQVGHEIDIIINHWPEYELRAAKMLEPQEQQLPLFEEYYPELDSEYGEEWEDSVYE